MISFRNWDRTKTLVPPGSISETGSSNEYKAFIQKTRPYIELSLPCSSTISLTHPLTFSATNSLCSTHESPISACTVEKDAQLTEAKGMRYAVKVNKHHRLPLFRLYMRSHALRRPIFPGLDQLVPRLIGH